MALKFHQEPGTDEAQISQQRENHRHVEGEAEGNDEHEQKVQIAFHGNERIDLACGKAEEKFQTAGKDESIGEQKPGDKKQERERYADKCEMALTSGECRTDEGIKLIEYKGRGENQAAEQRHLHINHEGFGRAHIIQLLRSACEHVHDVLQKIDAASSADNQGSKSLEQAAAQLRQMFCERHVLVERRFVRQIIILLVLHHVVLLSWLRGALPCWGQRRLQPA